MKIGNNEFYSNTYFCEVCEIKCNNNFSSPECKHIFCSKCTKEYFLSKLSESHTSYKIKCILSSCNYYYLEETSKKIIENDRDLNHLFYWNKIELIENSFPCPFPNCESYIILNELNNPLNKKIINDENLNINDKNSNLSIRDIDIKILETEPIILICKNNHKYCSKCLKPEHKNKLCNEDNKIFKPKYIYQTEEEILRKKYVQKRGCTGGRKCTYILDGCCMDQCCYECSKICYFRNTYECCETDHDFINVLIKIIVFPLVLALIGLLTLIFCSFPNCSFYPLIILGFENKIKNKYGNLLYALSVFYISTILFSYSFLILIIIIVRGIVTCGIDMNEFPFFFFYCHIILISLGYEGLIEDND